MRLSDRATTSCISVALLAAIFSSNFPERTFASIVQVQDNSILGNGSSPQDGFNITQDTSSGLDWLDLTLSTNRSFAFVITQLGSGGDYAGFRVATDVEIGGLFLSAGAPSINGSGPAFNAAGELLISAVGTTVVTSAGPYGSGFRMPNIASPGNRSLSQYADFNTAFANPFVFVSAGLAPDVASPDNGTWLVRQSIGAVPEPLSVVVWAGLALCGVAITKRRCRGN